MALNFGLGFSFGATDKGLTKTVGDVASSFQKLGKEILGLQRLQTFLAALSFDRLDDLGDKLKNLGIGGMELTSSIESTFTGYDKELRKFGSRVGYTGKQLKAFTAQASSMAYGLSMGAEEAGKAIYGYAAAYKELDASGKEITKVSAENVLKSMGLGDATKYAKFASVAEVSGSEFAYTVMNLAKSTGMGEKAVGEMVNMLLKFGETSDTTADSLGKLGDIQSILSLQKTLGATPKKLENFGKGIVAVADAYYKYSQDGKKALAVSFDVANSLTKTKDELAAVYAGAQAELPGFIKQWSLAGTGFDEAIQAMTLSPDVFLKRFAKFVEGFKGDQNQVNEALGFFRKHSAEIFGESTDSIVRMMSDTKGRAAILSMDVQQLVKHSANAAGKMAEEGYATGLTAADLFERQQQGFMQRFRKLTTITTGQFLKETQQSFNSFAGFLEKKAADNGPLGMFIRKMADIQKFGAVGLFPPSMQGPLVALGSTVEALISPLAKLRAAGINLASPFGVLAGTVGLLAVKFASYRSEAEKAFRLSLRKSGLFKPEEIDKAVQENSKYLTNVAIKNTANDVVKFLTTTLPQYATTAVKFVADFVRGIFGGAISAGITGDKETDEVLKQLRTVLTDAFKGAMKFLDELVTGLWNGITGETSKAVKKGDAETIGEGIGTFLGKAFDKAAAWVKERLGQWWEKLGKVFADDKAPFEEKLIAALKISLPIILAGGIAWAATGGGSGPVAAAAGKGGSYLGTLMGDAFKAVFVGVAGGAASAVAGVVAKHFAEKFFAQSAAAVASGAAAGGFVAAIKGFFFRIPAMLGNWAQLMWFWLRSSFLWLAAGIKSGSLFTGFVAALKGFFMRLPTMLGNWAQLLWHGLRTAAMAAVGFIKGTVLPAIGAALSTVAGVIAAAVLVFFGAMYATMKEEGDEFQDTWDRMWAAIFTTVEWYWDWIKELFTVGAVNIVIGMTNAILGIWNVFADVWYGFKKILAAIYNFGVDLFNKMVSVATEPMLKVINFIGAMIGKITSVIAGAPTIASLFGIDAKTLEGMKKAASSLQEMTRSEFQSGWTGAEKITVDRGLRADFYDLKSTNVKSLGARQSEAFASIEDRKSERERRALQESLAAKKKAKAEAAAAAAAPKPLAMDAAVTVKGADGAPVPVPLTPPGGAPGPAAAPTISVEKQTDTALLQATNRPAWVDEYFAATKTQTDLLKEMVGLLMVQTGKTTAAPLRPTMVTSRPPASVTAPPPLSPAGR